ncbi:hypothetical protein [Streptomyces sp. NPDC097619]|uniref:DUF6891 domain-containing protein n=1 Tax=Streptomyces sp. NPDC097619 TaxID=3157228 RepID=UPI003316F301
MLDILVKTEDAERHLRPTAEELAALTARIGAEGDRWLVLQRVPDLPDEFAQVWHRAGAPEWAVEYRDGSADRHFGTIAADAGAAARLLTSWARHEPDRHTAAHWERLDFGPVPEVPPLELSAEDLALLEAEVRTVLAAGYTTRDGLAEIAEEFLVTKDRRPVSPAQARRLADRLWTERVAEQSGWEGETDPERLTRAFAALEADGITARENFACCRTCGEGDIAAAGRPDARGYVYFHSQCTESAAAGHGLTLLYGGFDGEGDTAAAVGHELVSALGQVGLRTDWDMDPSRAITVTPLDWRRRLVG